MKRIIKVLVITFLLFTVSSTAFAIYDPNAQTNEPPKNGATITLLKQKTSFLDVENHQASKEINFVKNNGLMVGYPDNTFRPDREVTRLEFAVILDRVFDFNFRAMTFTKQPEVKDMFDDVYDGKWYSTPLMQTTFFGVLNTANRKFEPNNLVTRIEVAKAIQESFKAKELGVVMTQMFPILDDTKELSPEESSALSFVFNTGIMKGNADNNTFGPYQSITRAQLAGVLQRTMQTLKLAEPLENPLQK